MYKAEYNRRELLVQFEEMQNPKTPQGIVDATIWAGFFGVISMITDWYLMSR